MNYSEFLSHLFKRRGPPPSSSLDRILQIVQKRGLSHNAYPTIHVAGTNGKGSVSCKIAKVLEYAGFTVGLFTSPHLDSFCERIQVNTTAISEKEVVKRGSALLALPDNLGFFEVSTLMAFDYFRDQNVDVAVIEVGVGGLWDTTNIITPEISVITSITKDHEDLLGTTLEEIAYHKAGIIKPLRPVVIGPTADLPLIHHIAAARHSPLYRVATSTGFYDLENQTVACQVLELLKERFPFSKSALDSGLACRPPCRFEICGSAILDVAHNYAGFVRLLEAYEAHFPNRPFSAVVGMSRDKDARGCLSLLARKASHLYLVQSATSRALSAAKMGDILSQEGFSHFTVGLSIQESCEKALALQGHAIICGSFYIMKEARQQILRIQIG